MLLFHILGFIYLKLSSYGQFFRCIPVKVAKAANTCRPVHTEAFVRPIITKNTRFHDNFRNSCSKVEESEIDPEFESWKRDLVEIPGPWKAFLPDSLDKAKAIDPTPGTRPLLLFCDISGRVTGPETIDSPKGSFILDAKELRLVDDGENFIHSRKFVIILLSGIQFSNLRLVMAGRIFYSKNHVIDKIHGAVKLRSAFCVGQAFIESYDNAYAKEALTRLDRKVVTYDNYGNETDPLEWKYQELEAVGSPFRWMHGTNDWKLLGPFTLYKSLGGRPPLKERKHLFYPFNLEEVYNVVDPFQLSCKNHTAIQDLEKETHDVITRLFEPTEKLSNITIKDPKYLKELENELIQLGTQGPSFYKNTME
ncbi:conserved hypothetical protein [Theileria equi strain WA]|uniref:Uncharacterized protein n=1 Tax=Theileria equi strain WA TaxID=1537102 RepID=L1LEP8_THEEQ|nr:conserved hypothetical protein [Theileria equi strain WA]EKX73912.1 conserved hypothetical protein [Theileria equi strain WA]|eukprot:XP_004833364.1 conserved hypothetical protein [Theileria equi strain WA]